MRPTTVTVPTLPRENGTTQQLRLPTWRRRNRDQTVIGRLLVFLAAHSDEIRALLARWRRAALSVSGLGCLAVAAWMVSVPLGVAATGVGLLFLEYLTTPPGEE